MKYCRCGYMKKFVVHNVAKEGQNSTAAILYTLLNATISGLNRQCNLAIAYNIALCIWASNVLEGYFDIISLLLTGILLIIKVVQKSHQLGLTFQIINH